MLRVKRMVPGVYYEHSRDFQFIGRLYEIVLNAVKTNTDMLYNLPFNDNSPDDWLDLTALTLGFQSRHIYNTDQLRALCASFAEVIRNKGNIQSIDKACRALLSAEGIKDNHYIDTSELETKHKITIYVSQEISDINLLNDLLWYILPAGISCTIVRTLLQSIEATTVLELNQNVKVYDHDTGTHESETSVVMGEIKPITEDDDEPYSVLGKRPGFIQNTTVSDSWKEEE